MKHILKCQTCGRYSLKDSCPLCASPTINPKPPKYSPEDKYGHYRRQANLENISITEMKLDLDN